MRWLGIGGVLLVVLASPAAAQQAPAQQIEVTLQDALRRAQQVQPNMVQALGVERNAGASRLTAFGAYLPTLSLNASTGKGNIGRIDPTTGVFIPPVRSYTGGISARLQLFDGFRRIANLRSGGASLDPARARVGDSRYP